MPSLRARALGALCPVAALVVLAGCSSAAENGCNCCCSPVVDPSGDAVWVAQGTRLHKLDARTGAIEWTRQVTSRTPGGAQEVMAVSAAPSGVWVAWHAGAARIPGRTGRATRIAIRPAASAPTLATVAGHTWLGAGRRVIALRAGGRTGRVVRFPAAVRVEAAPGAVVVHVGGLTELLDPRTGDRLAGGVVSVRSAWHADARAGEVTRIDITTGAPAGAPVHVEQLGRVIETPDGGAYATALNHDLAVLRLDPDGPRIAWRTPIDPG